MSTVLRAVAVGLPGPAGGTLATGRSATTIVPGRSDAQVRADHARIGPAKLRARVRAQAHRRPGTARSGAPRGVRRAGRRRRARAGDGNRTRAICLEGRGSTIELHPRGRRRRSGVSPASPSPRRPTMVPDLRHRARRLSVRARDVGPHAARRAAPGCGAGGSASAWGAEGRRFESVQPDQARPGPTRPDQAVPRTTHDPRTGTGAGVVRRFGSGRCPGAVSRPGRGRSCRP